MFKDKENNLSTTKIMSFFGFFTFLAVSIIIVFILPEKFDYIVFSVLSAGSSASLRILDKYLNINNNQKKEG